VDGGGVNLLRC